MRLFAERACTPSQWASARQRLLAVDAWATWLPGLRRVEQDGDSYWLTFADARSTRVRVAVHNREQGVELGMVEGGVRNLDAWLRLENDALALTVDLDLNRPLPGVLARELQSVYPARLLCALLAEAEPEPVSPPSF